MTGDATAAPATGLAAPGARAVLVGTGRHASGSALPALPGVDTTLDDLGRILRDGCGMPEEHVRRVPADATAAEVIGAVEQAVAEATGTVLFCYTGHGLLGPGDQLYLATRGSLAEDTIAHGVPYGVVKDLLGGAMGGSVVVLDCCFSGRAAAPGRHRGVYDSALPNGSFLLTSASDFALSYAPEGERHTLFGGRLLRLLEEGDPSGPPLLTMDDVHAYLDRAFRDGPVRPHRQSGGTLGALVVAPNRAYRPERPAAALPPADVPCPYPGMEPFRPEDRAHFFGREEITGRLLDAVCDPAADGRPLVLVGASGAGKSSLLRAGLLAGLEDRHGAGRPGVPWPALLLPAPGPHPLRALAERWARATGHPADEVHRALAAGEELPAPRPGFPACRSLIVDQFEETFTRCADPEERTRFVRLLCATGGAGPARPRVVLGLRADHYGSCLAHPELVRALEHGQFTVSPMGEAALRTAVEQPALRAGLALEDGLTDRLMADLRQDSGRDDPADGAPEATALPFLAHALRETWLRRSGALLTLAGYQATGGIRESVATTTETLYQELDEPSREALRELLLRMIQLTANAEAVRRRVDLPRLLAERPEHERRLIADVCDRLAAARLVTVDQDGAQISHEALLRAWPRLRLWIRDARAELLAHQELSDAATAWEENGRDPGYLYTGSRLERIRGWLAPADTGPSIALTATERAFAEAGVRAARRRRRRRVAFAAVAACLALLLTGVGTFAVIERGRSQQRAAVLDSKLIAGQAESMRALDAGAALDLSLAAYGAAHTVEARTSLLRSAMAPVSIRLTGHTDQVLKLAFHKDGKVLASSSEDGTVRLWDTGDPYHPAAGPVLRTGRAVSAAWRPDGRYLMGATHEALFVWDTADPLHPRQVARVPAAAGYISSGVAFSPDGRTFAVPAERGRVWLWDVSDPAHPVSSVVQVADDKDGRIVGEVAYSPDGRVLAASVQDESVRLLDTGRARTLKPLVTLNDVHVFSLAFKPGSRLLVGGGIQKLKLWDTTDPAHPRSRDDVPGYSLSRGLYKSLAFRADGAFLAVADEAGRSLHTYEFTESRNASLDGDVPLDAKARSVAYQPDGRGMAVGDETGRIAVRESPPRSLPATLVHTWNAPGAAFDPAARHVVTGGGYADKSPVRIWDIGDTRTASQRVAELPKPWATATFIAHGRYLLSRNSDQTRLKLWHFDNSRLRPGYEFELPAGAVKDDNPAEAAVDREGTLLALRGEAGSAVEIWDIRDIDHPERLAQVPWPEGDGQKLLGLEAAGVLVLMAPLETQLWDVRDPRHPRRADTVKERPSAMYGTSRGAFLVSKEKARSTEEPNAHIWAVADDGTAKLTGSINSKDWTDTVLTSDRTLATLSQAGRPMLWDLRKPQQHGVPLLGPTPKLQSVKASRDSRLLAAWNSDGFLGLWRISDPDGAQPGGDDEQLVMSDGAQGVDVIDVSPDGDLFMTARGGSPLKAFGSQGLVVSTDFGQLTRTLCSVRTAPMSDKQWKDLLPGVGRRTGCE